MIANVQFLAKLAMDYMKLVSTVLDSLSIDNRTKDDQVVLLKAVEELCTKFSLKKCEKSSIAAVVSYAALVETLQQVAGLGTALGKIDFNGKFRQYHFVTSLVSDIALGSLMLRRNLERMRKQCGQTELKELLGFAKDFFDQGLSDLKSKDVDGCLMNLKHLNGQIKRVFKYPLAADEVLLLTQFLILSDTLLTSTLQSKEGTIIIPSVRWSSLQRRNIGEMVKDNCDRALLKLEHKKGDQIILINHLKSFA